MSQDGVRVQVGIEPQEKLSAKSPATLQEVHAAPITGSVPAAVAADESRWSSTCLQHVCLWALFVLGWVFPPCWWAGVAGGLRTGRDSECLIKRRKGLSRSSTIAWVANMIMTVATILVVVLVLSFYYGRPGPQQAGPYYITMAGPGDVFPDFSDARNFALMAQAVRSGLSLDSSYPLGAISVWLDSSAILPATPARRRLLQDDLPANETMEVAVLGYTLEKTPELPDDADLATRIEDGTATDGVSEALVSVGLVDQEHVGKLSIGLIGVVTRERLAEMLERKEGNPAFNLVPVGKRCKGSWTEWTECATCANRTRTFIVPPRVPEAEPESTAARRLHRANAQQQGAGNSNSNNDGNKGRDKAQSGAPQHGQSFTMGAQSIAGGQSVTPGFDKKPSGQGQQGQGLAHAFGQGNGLTLALGRIECAVINNTVQVEACECPDGYCTDSPASTDAGVAFEWECAGGTANGTVCAGACNLEANVNVTGIAEALCTNGSYGVTNHTCAADCSQGGSNVDC